MRVMVVLVASLLAGCAGPANEASNEPVDDADFVLNNVTAEQLYSHRIVSHIEPGDWSLFHIALDAEKYGEEGEFDGEAFFDATIKVIGANATMIELWQDASFFSGELEPGIRSHFVRLDADHPEHRLIYGIGVLSGDPSDFTYPRYELAWAVKVDGPAEWSMQVGGSGERPRLPIEPTMTGQGLDGGMARGDWDGTTLVTDAVGALSVTVQGIAPDAAYADRRTVSIDGSMSLDTPGFFFADGHIRSSLGLKEWRYDVASTSDAGQEIDGVLLVPSATGMRSEDFSVHHLIDSGDVSYSFEATWTGMGRTPATRPLWPIEGTWGYVGLDPYGTFDWPA